MRRIWHAAVGFGVLAIVAAGAALPAEAQKGCPAMAFEGEVQAGGSFRHALGSGQVFLLEGIASGWIVRVLPVSGERPAHDFAELATPPYRSPNPLLLSTDFSFRAQDAIAWNPREFRFFTSARQMSIAERAYTATLQAPDRPSAGAALFPLLDEACTAELRIVDARISGGTGDQAPAAAAVAQHFAQTAHTVETNTPASKLGRIVSLRFRVSTGEKEKPSPHE